jgi:O-antigen/teichoic acid export membrane protein
MQGFFAENPWFAEWLLQAPFWQVFVAFNLLALISGVALAFFGWFCAGFIARRRFNGCPKARREYWLWSAIPLMVLYGIQVVFYNWMLWTINEFRPVDRIEVRERK